MMTACIMVQARRAFFHAWPQAPDTVAFLRNTHRHVFHVKLSMPVTHSDRQKEFFLVQRWLLAELPAEDTDLGSASCEDLATTLVRAAAREFECSVEVEVWEDGENGARVSYEHEDDI